MQIGPYQLLDELGRGGNAVVFRARGPGGEDCAVKVLHRQDRVGRKRFLREAQVLAELSHPAIVPLRSVGEHHDGSLYIAMPFYAGSSLAARIEQLGALSPHDAVELTLSLADGLAYAHAHGVLHRDLKPDNVLLDDAGHARLTDFGLARRTDLTETRLSLSGALQGTPGFWAPEQAGAKFEIGPWTDVYGLGATLYCMLAGVPPLLGSSLVEVLRAVNEDQATPPSSHSREVDPDLDRICLRCLAKDPADRYPSVRALQEALSAHAAGGRTRGRPSLRLLVAVAALALLAVGGALWAAQREGAPPVAATSAPAPAPAIDLSPIQAQLQQGDYLAALKALDRLGEQSAASLALRVNALLGLGDHDAAHVPLERLLKLRPKDVSVRVQGARVELGRRRLGRALAHLARAIDLGGGPEVVVMHAEIRAVDGDLKGALAELRELNLGEPAYRPGWLQRLKLLQNDLQGRLEHLTAALVHFPDDPEFLRARGHMFGYLGRTQAALDDFVRIVELGEASASDYVACSMSRSLLGDHAGALADAGTAVGLRPDSSLPWRELGIGLQVLGQPGAREALTHAFALAPRDLRTCTALAQVCDARGAHRHSVALLEYALQREEPAKARLYTLLGRGLLKTRRFAAAERALTQALDKQPSNRAEVRGLRGIVRSALGGRDRDALADLHAGVEGNPDDPLLWHNLGIVYLNVYDDERACRALARTRALDPSVLKNVEFVGAFANALMRLGRHADACEYFAALTTLAPNDPLGWAKLAESCLEVGELERGFPAAQRAAELDPTDPATGCLLADYHARRGELKACGKVMTDLMALHPSEHKLRVILAEQLLAAGEAPLAEALFDSYLKLVPEDSQGYGRRGCIRAQQENYAGALEDFDTAVRLNPRDLTSLYNRGLVRMRTTEFMRGFVDMARVISLKPDHADAVVNYTSGLHRLGRVDEARATLDAWVQAYPKHPQVDELRQRLARFSPWLRTAR